MAILAMVAFNVLTFLTPFLAPSGYFCSFFFCDFFLRFLVGAGLIFPFLTHFLDYFDQFWLLLPTLVILDNFLLLWTIFDHY